MRVAVEVCVTSPAEALAAYDAGVDTVELCSWLAAGGITPSIGLVRTVRSVVGVPVRVLVRPRGGGFHFTAEEEAMMDVELGQLGGPLVIGALDGADLPDPALAARARLLAPGAELNFHRAIDHAADPVRACALCREQGYHRVLSSGGRATAREGAEVLRSMVEQAGNALTVAAAGGITPANVVEVVERSGVREVHFAAQRLLPAPSGPALSSAPGGAPVLFGPDRAKIEGVLNALVKAGLR